MVDKQRLVTIGKDSIIYTEWVYDEEADEGSYVETPVEPDDLLNYLWNRVALEQDVTLERIFDIVRPCDELWGMILNECVVEVCEEALQDYTPNSEEDIKYLELSHVLEKWIFKKEDCEENEERVTLSDYSDFGGVGEREPSWGISFSPVYTIKHFPVRLNRAVRLYVSDCTKPIGEIEEPLELGQRGFTVVEFLRGIFFELCFYGNPESRDEQASDIRETIEGIEAGTVEMIPMKEAKEQSDNKGEK